MNEIFKSINQLKNLALNIQRKLDKAPSRKGTDLTNFRFSCALFTNSYVLYSIF